MQRLTITQPDDWHLHLRDGAAMQSVVTHSARNFGRAIIMPNLLPPVTTVGAAEAYRDRILKALPGNSNFRPLMTLYLTDNTSADEIEKAARHPGVIGVKLYPSGATTNSDAGVTDIHRCDAAISAMQAHDLPLLVHGEVTDTEVDVFDREAVFIDTVLSPLLERFPDLKVVLEHTTTRQGIEFVQQAPDNVAASLTAHHLLLNRNALFQGGFRPHHYCLPVLKREKHRQALLEAATSGKPKFFLGTDSAPHARDNKEAACGCAGIYTAHAAIELYAEAFDQAGALDKLETFASLNGPAFYGLPANDKRITLIKETWTVPDNYPLGQDKLIPFRAGEQIHWKVETE